MQLSAFRLLVPPKTFFWRAAWLKPALVFSALLGTSLVLAGCGSLFGEAARPERIAIDEEAQQSETTPPLTSVPRTRPSVTSPEERAALEQQLRQDRARGQQAAASAGEEREDASRPEPVAVIHFAHGSAALSGEDRRVLQRVAELHRQQGGGLLIVGHASARTAQLEAERHADVNLKMSQRRAETVARALEQAGVPSDALRVEAVGHRERLYEEFMPSGEAGNRRAEIYLQN